MRTNGTGNAMFWTLVCVSIAALCFVAFTFNDLVADRNRVRAAWSDIDVQLQRRHDLIPQLVTVVQAYAEHERTTLTTIAELRSRAQAGGSIADRSQIEQDLSAQVSRLLAVRESYPQLKASDNFLQLQKDLVAVEDHLQQARSTYNDIVRQYNTNIQNFPDLLLVPVFGFKPADYFQAEDISAPSV
jgi:LemA protein